MGWCYLRQSSGDGWAEVSKSPDKDSGGGEATVGPNQYNMEVVN
jgi:hypothetical protein